jgi:NADP-dependent 3-hydroxy acid dehydrogenase YdfG
MECLQYLINNAGVASWGNLGALTEDELLRLFRTNTMGPLLVTQEVLNAGLLRNGSTVANLTSKVTKHYDKPAAA